MKSLAIVLASFLLVFAYGEVHALDEYEQGHLIGSLGFNAVLLDSYYEICIANGYRTENYLNGVNKLIESKFGSTFSEMAKEQEKKTGRNFRQEAHTMIKRVTAELDGCKGAKMKNWLKMVEYEYDKNLDKFHKLK